MLSTIFQPVRELMDRLDAVRWQKNSLLDWVLAAGALVLGWILLRTVHALLARHLRKLSVKTKTLFDDMALEVVEGTRWFFHAAVALLVARQLLEFDKSVDTVLNGVILVALFLQAGLWGERASSQFTHYWATRNDGAQGAATVAGGVRFVLQIAIWAVIALLILSNLGIRVSALLAGLGVGGIAAALALQSLLSDVFAGLSMYFDRPFDIGDFVAIGTLNGTVTRIGLRSTRVRALSGEEIVMPNGDLVKSRIQNFARMKERRIEFRFAIDSDTSPEHLTRVAEIAAEAVKHQEGVRLDRSHFKAFSADSLDFELVYIVESPDYNAYMDIQQAINVEIVRELARAGIELASRRMNVHFEPEEESEPRLVRRRPSPSSSSPPEGSTRTSAGA